MGTEREATFHLRWSPPKTCRLWHPLESEVTLKASKLQLQHRKEHVRFPGSFRVKACFNGISFNLNLLHVVISSCPQILTKTGKQEPHCKKNSFPLQQCQINAPIDHESMSECVSILHANARLSVCVTPTVFSPAVLLGWVWHSLYFRSSLCVCGVDVGVQCGGGWEGVSLLSCHYVPGWVSEGRNDCLAVWVLKRSNHTEVTGLTSIWSVQVFV